MKLTGYTAITCLVLVGALECANAAPVQKSVYMTSQIQRLLNEKQEKISKLEECDGKRKGFMIAGISTIGLTAVGVGVNIAQASKSNKLSNQIEDQKRQLEKQQANLADINSQISDKQQEENRRRECEAQEGKMYVNGQCVDKPVNDNNGGGNNGNQNGGQVGGGHDYSSYTLDCSHTTFDFDTGDNYTDVLNRLNNQCSADTGKPMKLVSQDGGVQKYECEDYPSSKCNANPGTEYDGIIGKPCNDSGSVWTADGDKKCLPAEGATETVDCSCPVGDGSGKQTNPEKPADQPNLEKPANPNNPEKPGTSANPKQEEPIPEVKPEDIERIVGMDCLAQDIPNGATNAKYVKGGSFKCFESFDSKNIVDCSCKAEACDELRGYSPQDGGCAEDPVVTGCKASGGDWKWLSKQKKYECHCGTLGNGATNNERGMKFTSANTCECLSGYRYIDENDHRKGCRLGSNRAEQDAFIESVNSLQAKWDSMNTKAKQCETAAKNVASATEEKSAKTFLDQATQYGSSAMSLASDVQGMYNKLKTEYNSLEKEDKTAVNRHKQSADTMKADADKVQSKVQGLISKANSDYMKLIERIEAGAK